MPYSNISDEIFSAYVRLDVIDKHGVLSNITNAFAKNKVSIKRLIQNPSKNKPGETEGKKLTRYLDG